MNKFITITILAILFMGCAQPQNRIDPVPNVTLAKYTILGFALVPAHVPNMDMRDWADYFNLAAGAGSHVTMITEWKDELPVSSAKWAMDSARAKNLSFHLYFDCISLSNGRRSTEIPWSAGGSSLKDPKVREAFKSRAIEFAALRPDYLGLGTEVNFLSANPDEFEAYVSLINETYREIKAKYPNQTVTVSFQWDVMRANNQSGLLGRFNNSVDVYSFTTYPSFIFKDPDEMPPDYYSQVRSALPTQRIGFSEIGWSSANGGEDGQARYYARIPQFMHGMNLEYATLGLMHDVSMFSGDVWPLNFVGVRNQDGTPKKSWAVIENLTFG